VPSKKTPKVFFKAFRLANNDLMLIFAYYGILSMKERTIKIVELLSTDIRSRNNADYVRKEIEKTNAQHVILDLSNVSFVSRSFADELLNVIAESHDKEITLAHLSDEVKTMIDLVANGRKQKRVRNQGDNSIIVLKDMNSVHEFFSTL
jgi:anti-anti-sigma regulatory factor